MGDKYVIEVEKVYKAKNYKGEGPDKLYRIKGFNTLVFDQFGLDKMEKYNPENDEFVFDQRYEDGYEKGLYKAWEIVSELYHLSADSRLNLFEKSSVYDIISFYNPDEVTIKLIEHKNKIEEDKIQVGDEVTNGLDYGVVLRMGWETDLDAPFVIGKSGGHYRYHPQPYWRKTGKHYPEIAEFWKKVKEEK